MIPIKSDEELKMFEKSGRILARVMGGLRRAVKSGISTIEIDLLAQEMMEREGSSSAFKGYNGFPANICVSVNEEVVHGIPGERVLKDGDMVSLDVGINYKGYLSDSAITVAVGRIDPARKKLIEVTRRSLIEGIKQARIDNYMSDISHAIQSYVERNGFSVVRQFVGHGIGYDLHEEPQIPNFGKPNRGEILKKGMLLAIEPMVNMGAWECELLDNGWTAVTKDGLPSAHFEHTVAVTERGPRILTD
ncbi:MAG: type I methionyl aminopeptidase [Candidatus Omnitrophota bacterium]|jgi:methionyl aminopeptidase